MDSLRRKYNKKTQTLQTIILKAFKLINLLILIPQVSRMTQKNNNWKVYIVKCSDGSLYTGCTTDVDDRIRTHNQGKGAKYTRGRLPVKLVYHEIGLTHSEALKREYEIKQLSHTEKQKMTK